MDALKVIELHHFEIGQLFAELDSSLLRRVAFVGVPLINTLLIIHRTFLFLIHLVDLLLSFVVISLHVFI